MEDATCKKNEARHDDFHVISLHILSMASFQVVVSLPSSIIFQNIQFSNQ